jgi:hypothetical protein
MASELMNANEGLQEGSVNWISIYLEPRSLRVRTGMPQLRGLVSFDALVTGSGLDSSARRPPDPSANRYSLVPGVAVLQCPGLLRDRPASRNLLQVPDREGSEERWPLDDLQVCLGYLSNRGFAYSQAFACI